MQNLLRRWWFWRLLLCALVLVGGTWFVFLRHGGSVGRAHSVRGMSKAELVNALFSEDKDLSNKAAIALCYGPLHKEVVVGPQTRGVKIGSEGSNDIVVIFQEMSANQPDSSWYWLRLVDQSGKTLDKVVVPAIERESCSTCNVAEPPEPDGAQLMIRTSVPEESKSAANVRYEICCYSKQHFGEVPRADYERLGLCRIAVQDHKFKVLFPKIESPRPPSKID